MNRANRILMNILWGLIVAVVVGLSAGAARGATLLPGGVNAETMQAVSAPRQTVPLERVQTDACATEISFRRFCFGDWARMSKPFARLGALDDLSVIQYQHAVDDHV